MLSMACSALLHLGNLPSGKAPMQGNVVLASSFKIRDGEYCRSSERVSAACLRYIFLIELRLKETDAHLTVIPSSAAYGDTLKVLG